VSERAALSHDEIVELLGAYALNAVEPDERTIVEEHLEDCPRCRAEVQEHVWVATRLGNSGGDAPDGLWERIAGTLEEAAPPMRLSLPVGEARVIPLAQRRRRVPRAVAAGIGIAAAGLIGVLGLQVDRQDNRIESLEESLASDAFLRAATHAFADPDAARADLVGADGSIAASAALLEDGSGYVMADGLPTLGDDRTYQLWGQTTSGLVSLGLLGSTPNEVVAFQSGDDVTALAITEEHAGGVIQSSNPPVVIGRLA
jgi:hypothetical protein